MAAAQIEREGRGFRLATVPALLLPGDFTPSVPLRMTPALWALVITWIAGLSALAAVGLVLRATLRLSDRRARFVGAVTHELRTPLTTFRLYAQMLAGGMVTDDKAKAEYLGTLERESIRLAEIVENVLEYARLTRRRPGAARPPGERSVSPSELLARVRPVLSRRAEQSGMDLIVSIEPGVEAPAAAGAPTVTCDPRSVERILMNLIENACKYAVPADPADAEDADTRIHLDLACTDRHLEILTADHGRGIPRRERERVFGEFQRGPGAAESSRPGLGLGLALSRGLAREMGGDLRLVRRRAHGAEFLLTIPLDPPTAPTP
jgi:signal transduction histidine kinase